MTKQRVLLYCERNVWNFIQFAQTFKVLYILFITCYLVIVWFFLHFDDWKTFISLVGEQNVWFFIQYNHDIIPKVTEYKDLKLNVESFSLTCMKIHIHTNSNKDEIKLIVSQILDLSCMNFQTQDLIKVKKKKQTNDT